MQNITISEGIGLLKTLRARHAELVALRNENSATETRFFGQNADKERVKTPLYDVKKLDKLVNQVASEIRKLDAAIKSANVSTPIAYEWDDSKLGQIE